MSRVKYSEFVDNIDVDRLIDDLEFDVIHEDGAGNITGYCLFPENHSHGDTTGKMAISREKKVYNCWVCGGGSLLSLVMELRNWDSEKAESYLRDFASEDTRGDSEFVDEFLSGFAEGSRHTVVSLPYFNPRVLDKWPYAYGYENISDDIIELFGVRFVEEAFKPAPKKGKYADEPGYTGPAVIFPHFWNNRLVGWQQRWMDPEDKRPKWCGKWTNTVDFPKEETLYGWDQAEHDSEIFLVESAKTVMYLRQHGFSALATFGDSIKKSQLKKLRKFQQGVILAPDNDPAGRKWLRTAREYLEPYVPLGIIPPVDGLKSDLADLPSHELNSQLSLVFDPAIEDRELNWAFPTT